MRKIYDLNNSGASADFRCKKARNHGDCRDSVKVYYLPSNSAKFGFYHLTRNQVVLTGSWVRIPPAPPSKNPVTMRVCWIFLFSWSIQKSPGFELFFP